MGAKMFYFEIKLLIWKLQFMDLFLSNCDRHVSAGRIIFFFLTEIPPD